MRKFSYAAVLILFFFAGCMQESNITEPVNSTGENQGKTIIMLPAKADMGVEEIFSETEDIDGEVGGEIHLVKSYQASNGQTVNIDCKLTVPADLCFDDFRNITMEVGGQAGVDFYPSMTFNQPVILNFTVTGLDMSGINPNNVGFFYVDQNGNLFPTSNEGVSVDMSTGTLTVVNAQLPHFSRWAYAR